MNEPAERVVAAKRRCVERCPAVASEERRGPKEMCVKILHKIGEVHKDISGWGVGGWVEQWFIATRYVGDEFAIRAAEMAHWLVELADGCRLSDSRRFQTKRFE